MTDRRTLIALLAAAALPARGWTRPPVHAPTHPPADPTLPHLLGPPAARQRFVIWGSYTCPFTAQALAILTELQAGRAQQLAVEWRHFPIHPPDPAVHVALQALGNADFWPCSSALLDIALHENRLIDDADLRNALGRRGRNAAWLAQAIANGAIKDAVRRDMLAGRMMGVVRTPGIFFNGYFLTPDGIPLDTKGFSRALAAMVDQS